VSKIWRGIAARPARSLAALVALLVLVAAWVLAAHGLWRSTVPSSLQLPHVAARNLFSASFLSRSASFERFLDIDALLGQLALIGAQRMRRGAALAAQHRKIAFAQADQ